MVFPSARCQTCRVRHVKCDETRPVCTQCTKASRMCTWFDNESTDSLFRDENDFASNRAKRKRGGGRRPNSANSMRQTKNFQASEQVSLKSIWSEQESTFLEIKNSLGLIRPRESLETHALTRLMQRFIYVAQGELSDIWTFLRNHESDFFPLTSHASFVPAITAFALMHFGRSRNHEPAVAASRQYYSRALLNTSVAVQDGITAVEDEVILTVLMLSGYENLTGNLDRTSLQSQGYSHLKGVVALMRAREQLVEPSERSRELNYLVRRRVIRSCVHHGAIVPALIEDGESYKSDPYTDVLYKCLIEIASIRNKSITAFRDLVLLPVSGMKSQFVRLQQIARDIQDINISLETWRRCSPQELQYETKTLSSTDYDRFKHTGIFYSKTYHYHQNLEVLVIWNLYRAARLITLALFNKFAYIHPIMRQHLSGQYAFDTDSSSNTIQRLTEDIAATVPQHFDAISHQPKSIDEVIEHTPVSTAFHLNWPLVIACGVMGMPDHLRMYMKDKLRLVGRLGGSKVLEIVADLDLHKQFILQQPNTSNEPTY